ncbi:hypothetical protein [Actinocatenispora rupis]|uniref:Uncharacterized protein n=1 Tax=Actinocatenispora rupis TaxID=519421 RepID=A0A8J3JEN0_9ACTN|nr:hypothetical protein [Actinocatenispora rupis]GID14533.1 hypothetical protein Aru02nite_54220 [Actinocatenispora rupis]
MRTYRAVPRPRPARHALTAVGALLVAGLALTGCSRLEHPTGDPTPAGSAAPTGVGVFGAAPSPSASPTPAQQAGGTCKLLDYDSVEAATGTRFQVAAASTASGARTCALQVLYSDYPDLTLSVVDTKADAKAFGKAAPSDASTVKGLGSAAYSRVLGAGDGAGPVVEVTWLGQHKQIVSLRYTYPKGTSATTAGRSVSKLVRYAGSIEGKR